MASFEGQTVYDEFGAWIIVQDRDGIYSAVQGDCEVLLLEQRDLDRFGIEADLRGGAA